MSYAQAFSAFKLRCTKAAVDGAKPSGVNVVTIIKSMSAAVSDVLANARSAAFVAKSLVFSPCNEICRVLIPVCD